MRYISEQSVRRSIGQNRVPATYIQWLDSSKWHRDLSTSTSPSLGKGWLSNILAEYTAWVTQTVDLEKPLPKVKLLTSAECLAMLQEKEILI